MLDLSNIAGMPGRRHVVVRCDVVTWHGVVVNIGRMSNIAMRLVLRNGRLICTAAEAQVQENVTPVMSV